jgi:hypothetical protein
VWRQAPVQLEICGTIPNWHDFGWTTDAPNGEVYRTFQWALDQHASVLNGKFTDIPLDYVPAIDDLLRQNGYRFVVDRFNHQGRVRSGEDVAFISDWSNIGVAPSYHPRALTYRLRGSSGEATFTSTADIRDWLPGSFEVVDLFTIPPDLGEGSYDLELALLDRPGTEPATDPLPPLFLGIEGRRDDGWYSISQVTVAP